MSKLKPTLSKPAPVATDTKIAYLPWPTHPREIRATPRAFRIHRLNAFEWQAYVIDGGVELPIGKPDLFDILKNKVSGVMRAEGQVAFMEAKNQTEKAKEAQHDERAQRAAN